jgi:hypothetical protein
LGVVAIEFKAQRTLYGIKKRDGLTTKVSDVTSHMASLTEEDGGT